MFISLLDAKNSATYEVSNDYSGNCFLIGEIDELVAIVLIGEKLGLLMCDLIRSFDYTPTEDMIEIPTFLGIYSSYMSFDESNARSSSVKTQFSTNLCI